MKLKIPVLLIFLTATVLHTYAQEYETCSFSGEEAWSGDTAAITAFLISCGRIDTTNYDANGKKTTGKPHHQSISMKLNNGKELHNDSIYFLADVMPVFPGGDEALMNYLKEHIHYPAAARAGKTEGKVVISFIIDRNGTPTNLKLVRGIGKGCDEEALRVVRSLPKWAPGKVKGKEVKVQMNLPVKFMLNG
jgi:protein TonB